MKLNKTKHGVSRFGIPNLSDEGPTLKMLDYTILYTIVSHFGQNNELVGKDMILYARNKP